MSLNMAYSKEKNTFVISEAEAYRPSIFADDTTPLENKKKLQKATKEVAAREVSKVDSIIVVQIYGPFMISLV